MIYGHQGLGGHVTKQSLSMDSLSLSSATAVRQQSQHRLTVTPVWRPCWAQTQCTCTP